MQSEWGAKLRRELVRPAKQLGRFIHRTTSRVYSPYLYDLTLRRRVQVFEGSIEARDHAAIYAIAPFHSVWPSHLASLDYLVNAGSSPIVVSNCPLSERDRSRLAKRATVVIERPNQGYDFGAYREGFLYLEGRLASLSRVSFFNDSVWFPVPGAVDWLKEVEKQGTQVTGAASNFGGSRKVPKTLKPEPWSYGPDGLNYHFPSYAISFSSEILRTNIFRKFWANYPMVNSKDLTVLRGEIGLTQLALAQGWPASSTYPVERMDTLLESLSTSRLREISQNLIVLGNPRFLALKTRILQEDLNREALLSFLLAATRCLGVSYAFIDFNLKEMKFPFLKKSPVWQQRQASDITMQTIRDVDPEWEIHKEAEHLRKTLLSPP